MRSQDKRKTKVYVAMSGGVDSSVAAALLKKQGFEVVGVFMRPWAPVDNRHRKSVIHSNIRCQWQRDREDAMHVASKIGIPLLTWDFSKEYKKEVADYMIREYKTGRTPNPDVMCNKHIKFGLFLQRALKEGADFIATGHYVRRTQIDKSVSLKVNKFKTYKPTNLKTYKLFTAKDKNKDQSYFLWTLTPEQLKYCLFPVGDYIKPEVRKLAEKFGLSTAGKKDSQGVCFVGPLNMKEFLRNYIKPKRGKIIELDKENPSTGSGRPDYKIIGSHDGAFYYTIGQRHGLDIKNGNGPYYVVGKDIATNTLAVAKNDNDSTLCGKELELTDVNFIAQRYSHILENVRMSSIKVLVRTRYRQPLVRARIIFVNRRKEGQRVSAYKSASVRVFFEKSQKAIAPGQSAVFYKGNEMLGGGIIS